MERARRRVVAGMVLAGTLYYTAWKSWAFVGPEMMDELGVTKSGLGSLSSALILAYAASKFTVAPLADTVDVRAMLSLGLAGVALVALAFSCVSSLPAMVLLWVANGLMSGASWPPCGKMLINWFPPSERGTWWGVISTTRPAAGAALAFIVPAIAASYGWRTAIAAPAVVALAAAPLVWWLVVPSPEALGLAPVVAVEPKVRASSKAAKEEAVGGAGSVSAMLADPGIWWLNAGCALCLAVKVALGDWLVVWMVEERGANAGDAGALIFWLEVGYGVGSLTCGAISDKVFGGSRSGLNAGAQAVATGALAVLFFAPVSMMEAPGLVPLCVFVFGAAVNMPATLIGMVASEMVAPSMAATACGLVGGIGYVGASLCGYPLGLVVQAYGWPVARAALVCASGGAAAALGALLVLS